MALQRLKEAAEKAKVELSIYNRNRNKSCLILLPVDGVT